MPSGTGNKYIAPHLCLGELGIFYKGYHPRGPTIEGRTPGTLRHDKSDMVLGLGLVELHFRTATRQRIRSPLRDWIVKR